MVAARRALRLPVESGTERRRNAAHSAPRGALREGGTTGPIPSRHHGSFPVSRRGGPRSTATAPRATPTRVLRPRPGIRMGPVSGPHPSPAAYGPRCTRDATQPSSAGAQRGGPGPRTALDAAPRSRRGGGAPGAGDVGASATTTRAGGRRAAPDCPKVDEDGLGTPFEWGPGGEAGYWRRRALECGGRTLLTEWFWVHFMSPAPSLGTYARRQIDR